MAKITFVIERLTYFKTLGGVIDEALKKGHIVNLLYDHSEAGLHHKGIKTPAPEYFPKFLHGKPNIVSYCGIKQLSFCAIPISDVVVLHCGCVSDYEKYMDRPETLPYQYQAIRKACIPVVSLHSHFYDNCTLKLNAYSSVDLTCLLSDYSFKLHKQVLLETSDFKGEKKDQYHKEIDQVMDKNIVITGSALLDLFDNFYQKNKFRNKKKDIILFHPKFMYRDAFMDIFARNHPRLLSAGVSLFYYKGKYFFKILSYPQYKKIIKKIEKVSKTYEYGIITKSRPKHGKEHIKKLKSISRLFLTGEEDKYYPEYTSLQILENAKFCVHIRTSSVMESVIAGIPSINIQVPNDNSLLIHSKQYTIYVELLKSFNPDTIFNYQGCVWNVPWKETLKFFDCFDSDKIEIDPERRATYIKYFCGVENESASKRQVNAIETLIT